MYARVMPRPPSSCVRQHGHVQSAWMAVKSVANDAWRRFRVPVGTMALPKRWWRGGGFRVSFVGLEGWLDYVRGKGGEKKEIRTAVLVGQTQSNMSAPRAMETRRSSG